MGFDFFKKKKGKGGDGTQQGDELQFDDIETSGEFLTGPEDPPAPSQDPYRPAAAPPSYPPPPPPVPSQPAYQPPPPAYPDEDITVVNRPPVVPPGPVAGAPAPPRPPAPPGRPVPPGPPANGQVAQPPAPPPVQPPAQPPVQPAAPPQPAVSNGHNGLADDEVTQVLNKPVSTAAVVAWLVVSDGQMRGIDFRLPSGTVRLGLNPACEIHLTGDTFISSQHAEISFRNGAYWLRDLGSTNGLFVNDTRISEIALNDGDQVKAGQTRLVFKSLAL